ncbi:unnamed protein product [Nippostrongylus brasiliensis]|uniref:ShKT domain-containing protein n=1 Tax=Nippostrongylus brasiliensis TaxID=27835 RepID=A0A3P7DJF6_NIPBR|nr:unnamed protein product [Nippostrongylus brasiliensis]
MPRFNDSRTWNGPILLLTPCCGSKVNFICFQVNCQKTCGYCSSSSTSTFSSVTNSNGGSVSACPNAIDSSTKCAQWALNGFCTSSFYTNAQKRSYCAKTCGLC